MQVSIRIFAVLAFGCCVIPEFGQREKTTEMVLASAERGVSQFLMQNGQLPPDLKSIVGNCEARRCYFEKMPTDAWGNEIAGPSLCPDGTVEMRSAGKDKIFHTKDDFVQFVMLRINGTGQGQRGYPEDGGTYEQRFQ
jgi:hypothetical protein